MNVVIHNPCILLMFSGGIDSLAALHILLNSPEYADYDIHCHHVHLHNIEGRTRAEANAIRKILDWYNSRNYVRLKYSDSAFKYPCFNGTFFYDSSITNFLAGQITASSNGMVKYVAYGVTKTDADAMNTAYTERGKNIFASFGTDVEKLYPVMEMTKGEIIKTLPPDLAVLAWSCRHPTYVNDMAVVCGKCKTCKEIDAVTKNS